MYNRIPPGSGAAGRRARMAAALACMAMLSGCIGAGGGGGSDDGGSPTGGEQFRLSAAEYTVDEADGTVTIPVLRIGGSDGSAIIDYSTRQLDPSVSGHARDIDFGGGGDYDGGTGTLTFADGVTQQEFTVPIIDDATDNPDLTFEVYLLNASIGVTDPTEATVTIIDDEGPLSTGAATLQWSAPTTRVDGRTLAPSELSGYVIYEGTSSDNLQRIATINDGSMLSHVLEGLVEGLHYFAVSATDSDGLEGPRSGVVPFTVQ